MQLDVICWFLLTSFIGVFADKRAVEQGSLVLLFENVHADNTEKEVNLYVNGVEHPTLVVTFKFVNTSIKMDWETDYYSNIFMDAKRNIRIANMNETYERKFYIYSSKILGEVELTISKANYSTTERTPQKETTQKETCCSQNCDVSDKRCSETSYMIIIAVLVIIIGMLIIMIVKKEHIIAWIWPKKSNSNNNSQQPNGVNSVYLDMPPSTSNDEQNSNKKSKKRPEESSDSESRDEVADLLPKKIAVPKQRARRRKPRQRHTV